MLYQWLRNIGYALGKSKKTSPKLLTRTKP